MYKNKIDITKPYESYFKTEDIKWNTIGKSFFEAVQVPKKVLKAVEKELFSEVSSLDRKRISNFFEKYKVVIIFSDKVKDISGGYVPAYNYILFDIEDAWFDSLNTLDEFWDEFSGYLGHEIVHMLQNRKRKIVTLAKKGREYFSDKDEIMAYAYTTVFYYMSEGYSKNKAIKAVQSGDPILNVGNTIYTLYNQFFKNEDNVVWNRYCKYVIEYIEKMM